MAIVAADSANLQDVIARGHEDGAAAKQAVNRKRLKYPPSKHPRAIFTPFVVESLGRPSDEAIQFLKSMAPVDSTERAVVLQAAQHHLSTLIAQRQAELLLTAEGSGLPRNAP